MIRINLLATERKAAKAASRGFQAGQKMMVVGSLLLVLTAVGVGWRYWTLQQQQAQVERDIEAAIREEARLAEILKQVADFEARKTQLENRVQLIDELRKGQTAPVHMLDQISKALPAMTWLQEIKQAGYTLEIRGRCMNLTSVSDFIGNLEASRYFIRPVEIFETKVIPGDDKQVDIIEFTIRGTFQMAGVESVAPPPPGTKKGGRRG